MPVTITINGENADHTLAELHGLSAGLGGAIPAPVGEASDTAQAEVGNKTGKRGKARAVDAAPVAADPKPAISTGEERVDTSVTVETKTEAPAAKVYTVDDVRKASKAYIDKWTLKVASVDLTPCLMDATGKQKISDLDGADQETLKKAVDAFTAAGEAKDRYVPKAA